MSFEDIKKAYQLDPKKEKPDLCKFKITTQHGKNPLTVGIIVSNMKDPRSQIRFDSGNGKTNRFKGGNTFIYNIVYRTGNYTSRFLIIAKDNSWKEESFEIKVEESDEVLIQKFSQKHAAGHVAEGVVGSGLDVLIQYTPRAEAGLDKVDFGHSANMAENNMRNRVKRGVAHHFYDKGGTFKGELTIEASSNDLPKEKRKFMVIMHKLEKGNRSTHYYPPI